MVKALTVFEALMIAITFGLLIVAIMSDKHKKISYTIPLYEGAVFMIVTKTLQYEDIKNGRSFRMYPSRRGTSKQTDPEQIRIFMMRQKNLCEYWRKMGIVSWKLVEVTVVDKDNLN